MIDSPQVYDQHAAGIRRRVRRRPEALRSSTTEASIEPIFDQLRIESQIHANLERKVWLKSGGSLIVDQSEALTAIDVNTGRFVGKRDLEETVLQDQSRGRARRSCTSSASATSAA